MYIYIYVYIYGQTRLHYPARLRVRVKISWNSAYFTCRICLFVVCLFVLLYFCLLKYTVWGTKLTAGFWPHSSPNMSCYCFYPGSCSHRCSPAGFAVFSKFSIKYLYKAYNMFCYCYCYGYCYCMDCCKLFMLLPIVPLFEVKRSLHWGTQSTYMGMCHLSRTWRRYSHSTRTSRTARRVRTSTGTSGQMRWG